MVRAAETAFESLQHEYERGLGVCRAHGRAVPQWVEFAFPLHSEYQISGVQVGASATVHVQRAVYFS